MVRSDNCRKRHEIVSSRTFDQEEPRSEKANGDRDEKEPEAGLGVCLRPAEEADPGEGKPVDQAQGQDDDGEH